MKIEDVKQIVFEVVKGTGKYDGSETSDSVWEGLDDVGRLFLTDLVNACELRGVERAKTCPLVSCSKCMGVGHTSKMETCRRCQGFAAELDHSELDRELAKERAERAKFFGGRYDEANGFQPLDKVSAYPAEKKP